MLMVHLSDQHLSPTGYVVFPGSKKTLHSVKDTGMPLEFIAKGTVMQMALNLSVFKLREDIVYENANINTFACDTLIQGRNKKYFPGKDIKKEWLDMDHVAHMLKYFGRGENRPVNGSYFGLVPHKKGKYVMP